jgi:hypothetical protein
VVLLTEVDLSNVITRRGLWGVTFGPAGRLFVVDLPARKAHAIQIGPASIVVEQETPDGTVVEFDVAATDICDTDVEVVCTPPSGSVFPLGETVVMCVATDDSGNSSTATFTVKVEDTTPPDVVPSGPVTVEQTNADGTLVPLEPPAVTDICDAAPTVTNDAPAVFPLGETVVTWTAIDFSGNVSTAAQLVTVEDTTPPVLVAPADVTAEQTALAGTPVDIGAAAATDICDTAVDITNDAPAVFPLGETIVTWTAEDESGNVSTATQTVTVVDTTPPEIGSAWADPSVLWAPNHKMVEVTVHALVTDICDVEPTFSIISVESNEPLNGKGDGNTDADWEITGDHTVSLRAERSGPGEGRIYTITILAVDDSGNTSEAQVQVTVPHDQAKGKQDSNAKGRK